MTCSEELDRIEGMSAISPEDFANEMDRIASFSFNDEEIAHLLGDRLMMRALNLLGYEKGVGIFWLMDKWYA